MSSTSDQLMKQLYFVMRASRYYLFQNKELISGQKRVLTVLKLKDGQPQNYLATILALKPGSLAELLKKMELKGDIRREVDDQDKRVKRVYLTPAGKRKAAQLVKLEKGQDSAPFFAGLTADEQKQFSHYLTKITEGWDEDFKQKTEAFIDPAYRMKMIEKWRQKSRQHDFSGTELSNMCFNFNRENRHHHCHPNFNPKDFRDNYCDFNKIHQYDRDFCNKFWHNKNEDL